MTEPLQSRWMSLAMRLCAIAAFLYGLDALGIIDASDAALRRAYYAARGARDTDHGVVLVAVDDATIAAWGPQPWPAQRRADLHAAIAAGRPRAVIDESADLDLGRNSPVESIVVRGPIARVVGRADGDLLAVNYVGERGLPTVPAHQVAAGDIPARTFAGKIVVVGATAAAIAGQVPTPIGAMAAAQVQAHALLGADDGVAFAPAPGWLRAAIAALLAILVLVVAPLMSATAATMAALAAAALLLVVDAALFAAGVALLGAAAPMLALLLAFAAHVARERRAVERKVASLRASLRADERRTDDEADVWARIDDLVGTCVDCHSSFVAELAPGGWRLELRALGGAPIDRIADERRDVRLEPFRRAHLTQNPVWHPDFMAPELGVQTLLVPLVVDGRSIGLWLVNVASPTALVAAQWTQIRAVASRIAARLAQRRSAPTTAARRRRFPGGIEADLQAIERGLARERHARNEVLRLAERLPLGLAVATRWGEIRYRNAALGEASAGARSLVEILEALTGLDRESIHLRLRSLVGGVDEVRFAGRPGASHEYALASLPGSADDEPLLLLCAIPAGDADDAIPRPFLATPLRPRSTSSASQTIPVRAISDAAPLGPATQG